MPPIPAPEKAPERLPPVPPPFPRWTTSAAPRVEDGPSTAPPPAPTEEDEDELTDEKTGTAVDTVPSPQAAAPPLPDVDEDVKPNIAELERGLATNRLSSPTSPPSAPQMEGVYALSRDEIPSECMTGPPAARKPHRLALQRNLKRELRQERKIATSFKWRGDGLAVDWKRMPERRKDSGPDSDVELIDNPQPPSPCPVIVLESSPEPEEPGREAAKRDRERGQPPQAPDVRDPSPRVHSNSSESGRLSRWAPNSPPPQFKRPRLGSMDESPEWHASARGWLDTPSDYGGYVRPERPQGHGYAPGFAPGNGLGLGVGSSPSASTAPPPLPPYTHTHARADDTPRATTTVSPSPAPIPAIPLSAANVTPAERMQQLNARMDLLLDKMDRWTRLAERNPLRSDSVRRQIERTELDIFELQNEMDAVQAQVDAQ